MRTRIVLFIIAIFAIGCGSPEPEHQEKPLTEKRAVTGGIGPNSTAEEKIKYIENSKAPEQTKKDAIAKIKAGQL
jgi:hypothetical protein